MKKTTSILATNWVHLVGFFITTYLSLAFFKLIGLPGSTHESWAEILLLSLLTIPLLYFHYGIPIILGFYAAILILDIIAFNVLEKYKTSLLLLLEWLLIVPIFISWAFEYDYWLWLTLPLSFLVTQYLREKKIRRIIEA